MEIKKINRGYNLQKIGEANAVSAEEITASMMELSKIAEDTKNKINSFELKEQISTKENDSE